MSARRQREVPHPRETLSLYGHAEAEQAFLDAYRGGRMPHAWLIGGPRGIGKATLAYRMARFVFAHPDPAAPTRAGRDIARAAAGSSGGAPRRRAGPQRPARAGAHRGRQRQAAHRDPGRRWCASTIGFFGSTAGEGGWRVCIVDSADELNAAGANALLKILEEPPRESLLLVVSHAPGRLLPTIRSRCRRLALRPLGAGGRRARGRRRARARRRRGRHQGRGDRLATAASRARSTCSAAPRCRCASGSTRCSARCRRSIRATCMRSATRSGATRPRSRPSSMRCATGSARA